MAAKIAPLPLHLDHHRVVDGGDQEEKQPSSSSSTSLQQQQQQEEEHGHGLAQELKRTSQIFGNLILRSRTAQEEDDEPPKKTGRLKLKKTLTLGAALKMQRMANSIRGKSFHSRSETFNSSSHQEGEDGYNPTTKDRGFRLHKTKFNIPRIKIVHEVEHHKYVVGYDSKFRQRWDMMAVLFVLYLSFRVPIEFAFDNSFVFPEVFSWINTLMDIFFYTDIALNFRTGFVHSGHHITDPKLIAHHYLSFWFWVDVVASIPFESLLEGAVDKSTRKSLKILKWLKFPKLLRLGRFLRSLKSNARYYQMFVLTSLLLFFLHFLACLYSATASPCVDPILLHTDGSSVTYCTMDQVWAYYFSALYTTLLMLFNVNGVMDSVKVIGSAPTYTTTDDISTGNGTSLVTLKDDRSRYFSPFNTTILAQPDWYSLYKKSSDIFIEVSELYLISSLCLVVGFALITQIVAEIVSFSFHRSEGYRRFYGKVELVQNELTNAHVSEALQYKVRRYYDYLWVNQKMGIGSAQNSILHDPDLSMPLKKELAKELHFPLLSRITIFDGCSEDVLFDIAMRLRTHVYMPGDIVFEKGDAANELYLVREGVVCLTLPPGVTGDDDDIAIEGDQEKKYLGEGTFFGEISLLTQLPRSCTAIAHTMCELSELSQNEFHSVLIRHPQLSEEVIEEVSEAYPHLRAQIELYSPKRARKNQRFFSNSTAGAPTARKLTSHGITEIEPSVESSSSSLQLADDERFQRIEQRFDMLEDRIEKLVELLGHQN